MLETLKPFRKLIALWLFCLALALAGFVGSSGLFWSGIWSTVTNIQPYTAVGGSYAYTTVMDTSEMTRFEFLLTDPMVYEDGRWLDLPDATPGDIATLGTARYTFSNGTIIFSTRDNTDPRSNSRHYQVYWPLALRARIAWPIYLLAILATLGLVWSMRVPLGGWVESGLARPDSKFILFFCLLGVLGFISIGVIGSIPRLAGLSKPIWVLAVVLNAISAWALHKKFGGRIPRRFLAIFLLALAIAFFLLTVVAPKKIQACKGGAGYSSWNAYCTSGDSGSYYTGWQPGSTRQPLYPWFIRILTIGTGFDSAAYAKTMPLGVAITNPNDPLLQVERVQTVLLLGAALVACWTLMVLLNSPLPAVLFLFMYDYNFITGTELNTILTEPLVQVWLFLIVAVFCAFIWRGWKSLIPLAGVLCGLIYLTRQASGYAGLFLAAMILWALVSNRRAYWRVSLAAILILVVLAVVPDAIGYLQGRNAAAQQTSLQYQYRIAYAMQVAQPEDIALMPDEVSRQWLTAAIKQRDIEHRRVDAQLEREYDRMVYYISANLYDVAFKTSVPDVKPEQIPDLFMRVATPILARHWFDYLWFGFKFWVHGITEPGLARLTIDGIFRFLAPSLLAPISRSWLAWFTMDGIGPWVIYLLCLAAILFVRGRIAFTTTVMILAHFGHVALQSLFAAPLPRMVWASDLLVLMAMFLLVWGVVQDVRVHEFVQRGTRRVFKLQGASV